MERLSPFSSFQLSDTCPYCNLNNATATGLPYSRPPAMFLQLLCQASVPRCQAQTRSRCCWQHLTASRTKLIQPSNSCFRGRLARFGSFGRRRKGQLEVCTASLKYSSALMENLIWSPLTRMYHTWVNLFNPKTYLQAEVALPHKSLCTNEYISRANLLSTPPAPSTS